MPRKRSTQIVVSYVASLLVTISLLVGWVIYVLSSISTINDFASRLGGWSGETVHWIVLGVGCALFSILIVGLTLQLAQTFAERRYSRKQEEFISNITHEMKSPLAAIKLHAQTLQEPDVDATAVERSIALIVQQAERMGRLVDNVLESSRITARKQILPLEPIPIRPFFASYLEDARHATEGRGVRLASRLESDATVLATPDALHRIMNNLIDNAVRFSERGGEVRCSIVDRLNVVRIVVEDDGIGIPKKELQKVFDRFYQAGQEVSGRRRGTGLGLSIVSGLVKELKGSVKAVSQEGRPGARFVVELPAAGQP